MKSQHLASRGETMKTFKLLMVEKMMPMERTTDGVLSRANVHVGFFPVSLSRNIYLMSHIMVHQGSKRELPMAEKAPETLTKKQRQNLNKREAQKAAKAAAETERLATLAKHKRELERIRIIEQSQSNKKGKASGGMRPVVDERGKLVWE